MSGHHAARRTGFSLRCSGLSRTGSCYVGLRHALPKEVHDHLPLGAKGAKAFHQLLKASLP